MRPKDKHPAASELGEAAKSVAISNPVLGPQLVGNIGLYYCCYRLSLLGWNVMPTARNARGVDLIAYSSDATRMLAIQVKALTRRNPVPLGNSLEKIMGDFWVIVSGACAQPTAYVLKPDEVRICAHRGEKDGKFSFWLPPKKYDSEPYRERWDRIGTGV